ncbi:MAG: blue (type 1) copper domain protein [Solirubrobacterales bacterium]|nr:blue (type 1) copper domain protein [Solirubrobacterales bacterium]
MTVGVRHAGGDWQIDIQHQKGQFTMRPRMLLLLPLATLLAAGVAVPPALAAAPSEAKLEVNENCVLPNWPCWATPGSSQPAAKVTIAAGGSITFADDKTAANIAWTGTAPTCESSVPVAPASPATGWEGRCTFATPGTYKFESSTLFDDGVDNYTRYEVVVEGSATGTTGEVGSKGGSTPGTTPSGSTPGTTPSGSTPSASTPGTTPSGPRSGSPLSGTPKISSSQRGPTVKGSVEVSAAGAGGRLEVDLIAATASPAKAGHATQVVGRFSSSSVAAGRRSFSVALDGQARRALAGRHHLAFKVKITLTPINGKATIVTTAVTLHA